MAVGGIVVDGHGKVFSGRVTASVVITSIVAASGGLIFGYDIGISDEVEVPSDVRYPIEVLGLLV
ncbi:Sugar transport protein 11, partial [Sarracenia purpurea var. burkii]